MFTPYAQSMSSIANVTAAVGCWRDTYTCQTRNRGHE